MSLLSLPPSLSGWMAVQSVPRLSSTLGVELELPEERMIYGLPGGKALAALRAYNDALGMLIEDHGVSWVEVYGHTDVGRERRHLVEEMRLGHDGSVVEVACGRGYTTIPLAERVAEVTSIDLMNGYGRTGWWGEFRSLMGFLGLLRKVSGIRSEASRMPLKDDSFPVAMSAHAMRNFPGRETIVAALREMRRITWSGGRVIIAENIPVTTTKAQEAHLMMFNLKTRLLSGEKPLYTLSEYREMFVEAGLEPHDVRILNIEYSATPPIFIPDPDVLNRSEQVREEYENAVAMIREHGEVSPPVLFVEAEVK